MVNQRVLLCRPLWQPSKSYCDSRAVQSFSMVFFFPIWVLLFFLVLTNLPFSSFRPESSSQHCRQRSGSLESQSHLLSEMDSDKPFFSLSKSQRSSSTEILDDGSSYTSQSSTEYYCVTPVTGPYYTTQTLDTRTRGRRRSKKQNVSTSNSGSMPNLAQKDSLRNGVYSKSQEPPSSSYYIAGYTPYAECDFYYSGSYVYENDTEGQYSVNPSYRSSAHYGYERQRDYSRSFHEDEVDRVPHNPYATLRLPRKAAAKSEHITKNIHKALVAEHLRGWYQRATGQKDQGHSLQTSFDSDRGSQRCLGFAGLQVPCSPSSRASSYSSGENTVKTRDTWILFTSCFLPTQNCFTDHETSTQGQKSGNHAVAEPHNKNFQLKNSSFQLSKELGTRV